MAEKIQSHFQDGTSLGVRINYLHESEPLGTGGALSMLKDSQGAVLVMNADILTDVDFRAMHAYHREQGASLTVAVGIQETIVPFGVVECSGLHIDKIVEKPTLRMMINAGIYLVEPEARALARPGEPLDMPDLVTEALRRGLTVIAFPLREGWIDIGTPEDYARAQQHMERPAAAASA
jgi:NDP-sugar pyrophosphorylase family protein